MKAPGTKHPGSLRNYEMTKSLNNRNGGRRRYKSQRHRKYVQQDHYMNITPNRLDQQKIQNNI